MTVSTWPALKVAFEMTFRLIFGKTFLQVSFPTFTSDVQRIGSDGCNMIIFTLICAMGMSLHCRVVSDVLVLTNLFNESAVLHAAPELHVSVNGGQIKLDALTSH